ncbi:MAG: transcriptional regulator [Gammaproteobacteria bacterium]|nr:transcriptional regulator [Gammaproteobacteria bacterium]
MIIKVAQNILTASWYGALGLALLFGWAVREQRYLVAETGIGYWFGIVGGSMMLMLLIYPLRKRRPGWHFLGSIKFWFRLHMMFGVIGPTLVIFHSGFKLGSLNGRVAFFSMIIVALSGLVGRYLYRSIHHGLYGKKIRFEELYKADEDWVEKLPDADASAAELAAGVSEIESQITDRHTGINRSYRYYRSMRSNLKQLQKKVKNQVLTPETRQMMLKRIMGLQSICRFGIHEILFSYWHILHLPLFIMLIISASIHVVVVHFY